jgi:hypothetical protein
MERRRAHTPMAACLKLSAMMWDSLLGSQGLKAALDSLLTAELSNPPPRQPAHTRRSTPARILPFRKPVRRPMT